MGVPGSDSRRPRLPELEWTRVPASHRYVSKRIQLCSYLQNVEGEVDSSHVSFLHSKFEPNAYADNQALSLPDFMARDRAPQFFVQPTHGMQSPRGGR